LALGVGILPTEAVREGRPLRLAGLQYALQVLTELLLKLSLHFGVKAFFAGHAVGVVKIIDIVQFILVILHVLGGLDRPSQDVTQPKPLLDML